MQVHNEIIRNIARNCAAYSITEEQVYALAKLDPELIAPEDGMQDWRIGVRVWESALRLTNYRLISLSFGKNITFSSLGWIAPLTASSPILAMAWKSFTGYFPLMGDMFAYHMQELPDGSVKIIYQPSAIWVDSSPVTAALAVEHAMSLTLSLSGYLSGKIIRPVYASLAYHTEGKYLSAYQDLFGQVHFGAAENALVFDKATSGLPLISANKLMYENMSRLCEEKMRELQSQAGMASRVSQILHAKKAFYNPKVEEVAAMLNMSARTLQRKLKDEHKTYQQVLEEYQVEAASQLLTRPGTRVQEVAFLLGFTSLQSFSRSFKRKTGMSPRALKQKA